MERPPAAIDLATNENMPKSMQSGPQSAQPKGVLMRLGIDPSTYQVDDAPLSLLERIRKDS